MVLLFILDAKMNQAHFFTLLDYSAVSGRENDTDELNLGAKLHWHMKKCFFRVTYYRSSRILLGLRLLGSSYNRYNDELHIWGMGSGRRSDGPRGDSIMTLDI
jgi:hypothetical protein